LQVSIEKSEKGEKKTPETREKVQESHPNRFSETICCLLQAPLGENQKETPGC
jgi:hypothetical protein